ncbi:MAG TPA: hypothetical protein VFN59_06625 [Acidimicrobiales bacterium]|nr:hypothetical protein [Acidimicrobiales bacterium]
MDRVKSTATWVITAGVTVIAAFGVARGVIDASPAANSTAVPARVNPTTTTTLAPTSVVPTVAHAVTVSSPSGTRQGDDSSSGDGTGGDS